MIVKIVMTIGMLIALNACANDMVKVKKERIVMPPLPQKCGEFDIVYGSVDAYGIFRTGKGTLVNLLDGVDAKQYAGKALLLSGEYWYQRGGLLSPDGRDASFSVDNLLKSSLIQIVEKGNIDMDNLKKVCNQLKEIGSELEI